MAGATNTEEAAILDQRLDVAGLYLALYTVLPADDGTGGTEVMGGPGTGNYARKAIQGTGPTDWNAAVVSPADGFPSYKTGPRSTVTWAFGVPSADWGDVVGFGIYAASTGGSPRYVGSLNSPQTILNGATAPQFDSTHQVTVQIGDEGDTF